jgi:hypothetical protein
VLKGYFPSKYEPCNSDYGIKNGWRRDAAQILLYINSHTMQFLKLLLFVTTVGSVTANNTYTGQCGTGNYTVVLTGPSAVITSNGGATSFTYPTIKFTAPPTRLPGVGGAAGDGSFYSGSGSDESNPDGACFAYLQAFESLVPPSKTTTLTGELTVGCSGLYPCSFIMNKVA